MKKPAIWRALLFQVLNVNTQLLIRPSLSVIVRQTVGCAMRTIAPIGAHGAPYAFTDNSGRINSTVGTARRNNSPVRFLH